MADTTGYPELDSLLPRVTALASLDQASLEREEIALVGRKAGEITAALKTLAARAPEERRAFGAAVNALKLRAEAAIAARRAELDQARAEAERRSIDLTMPARRRWVGAVHPVSAVIDEISEIFRGLGFAVALGPEIETDWYNFLALNFPADHPAMDLHDTLYLDVPPTVDEQGSGRLLLRTHTSPVQIRVMHASEPPIRVIMPGMVYRSDAFDPSHAPAFEQIEGLAIDEGVSFVDLKATLTHFARRFFSPSTAVRFRPSFFPFTEPSAEVDIAFASGPLKGRWLEVSGCGQVHPNVVRNFGLDPERYIGFAFGSGIDRLAMLRYGVSDLRLFFEGDLRFLSQFR